MGSGVAKKKQLRGRSSRRATHSRMRIPFGSQCRAVSWIVAENAIDDRDFASDGVGANGTHAALSKERRHALVHSGLVSRVIMGALVDVPMAFEPAEIDQRDFVLTDRFAVLFFVAEDILALQCFTRLPIAV